VADGALLAQAVTADPGWSLEVDGREAGRSELFGWGQQFAVPASGEATLGWSTPLVAHGLQAVQVVALLALVTLAGRRRRLASSASRRRIERPTEPVVVVRPAGDAGGSVPASERGTDPALAGHADPEGGPGADPDGAPVPGGGADRDSGPVRRVRRRDGGSR
jgi:hypothetical protein